MLNIDAIELDLFTEELLNIANKTKCPKNKKIYEPRRTKN